MKWLYFAVAPIIGMALWWWADSYGIKFWSKQMLLLMVIMFFDRLFYHLWANAK